MERSIPTRRRPAIGRFDQPASRQRIALLGVPVEVGASQPGALMGPAALRTAGLGPLLENLGFSVEDHGDISAHDLVARPTMRRRRMRDTTARSGPGLGP